MLLSYSYSADLHRSSHLRCSKEKRVLKIFAKFTGKHLFQSLFFNKVAGLRPATLVKKRLWHKYFPINFPKPLRTPILKNVCERLLLDAGWRTMQKLSRRDLLLLTCLVQINTSVSFFQSFIYDFFMRIYFDFDETKLTNVKLYGELRPVKYYIKELD